MSDRSFILENLISLKETISSKDGHAADDLANEICKHALGINFSKDLDYTCSLLFSEENGFVYFLKRTAVENAFKDGRTKILEFMVKFLDLIEKKIQPFISVLKNIAMATFLMDSLSKNKDLAVQLLIKMLENYQGSEAMHDLQIDEMVSNVLSQLLQASRLRPTVKASVYHLLGVLCEKFPEHMLRDKNRILSLFRQELKQQLYFKTGKNIDYNIIAGCLQGLSGYLYNFTHGADENPEISREIFECALKVIMKKDVNRYAMTTAALNLLGKHCQQFSTFIYERHELLYGNILHWVKHNNKPLRKTALSVLDAFFQQMAEMFLEKSDDLKAKGVFQFYIKEFQQLMNNVDNSYELSVAIRGYGSFAAPCKIFLSDDDVRFMLNDIILRSEQIYSNPDSEVAQENIQNLPSFIESIASIVAHVNIIDQTLQRSLECLVVLLIENYPQIAISRQFTCSKAILNLLFSLHSKQALYKSFLSRIVFQGLLRTCSYPATTFEEQFLVKSDNDEVKDARKVGTKDYVNFWKDLLNVVNIKLFANRSLADRESIEESIYDEIIRAIFDICQKLDLETRKLSNENQDENEVSFDPVAGLEPVNVNDFEILVNLQTVSNDLLLYNHCNYFVKWVHQFSLEMISFCTKYPLVSAFYKMLEVCFKLCSRINYFQIDVLNDSQDIEMATYISKEQKKNCWRLFSKFIQEVTVRMHQFKDDLLASCLQMLLSLSKQIVHENLSILVTSIQMALRIGLSYLPLAISAVSALETWNAYLKPTEIEPYLSQIVPCLNEYLTSSTNSLSDYLAVQTSNSKRGKSKMTIKNINKGNVQIGFEDIRFRILLILGNMGSKAISYMVASSSEEIAGLAVAWDDKKHLEFAMPFADMKPVIYLDIFLPRVIDLAKTASDRQTKVAACELLHCLTLFMIGTGALKPDSVQAKFPMDKLYQHVFPAVLSLACDSEQVAKQLFESLSFQMIHWFTNCRKYESVETKALLDVIMNCIVHSSDPRLRDFGARCLKEFVTWSIKQSNSKNQVNITSVVKRVCSLSLHPNVFNRLGAALAFNSIYTILREDETIISVFIVDLLYHFVSSLAMAHCDEQSFATKTHCINALDHIQRIICTKSNLMNQEQCDRRIPKEIQGGTLDCIVMWLLQQCGCPKTECRRKCMRLVYEFTPKISDISSCQFYFQNLLVEKGQNFFIERFEGNLLKDFQLANPKDENFITKMTNWLDLFLAPLDCYVWVFGEKLLDPSDIFLNEAISYLPEGVSIFLSHFNHEKHDNSNSSATPKEIDAFEQAKCSAIIRLIDLVVVLLDNYPQNVLRDFSFLFHNSSLWNLFARVIVEPNSVGFNLADSQVVKNLPREVEHLLVSTRKNLPHDLLKKFQSSLNQQLQQSNCAVLFTSSFNLNEETVSLKMEQYVKAIELVHSTGFLVNISDKISSTLDISKHFLHIVFESVVSKRDGKLFSIRMEPTISHLANKMLNLALKLGIPDSDLTQCLLNDTSLLSTSLQSVNKHGDLFLSCFGDSISSHVASNSFILFSMIIEQASPVQLSQILVTILDHIGKSRNIRKTLGTKVITSLMKLWPKLNSKCSYCDKATELNTLLAILTKMLIVDSKVICDETNPSFELVFISYLNMFNDRNSKLSFKSRLIDFLPFFTKLNDQHTQQLKKSLMEMNSQCFPLDSKELNPGTIKCNEYVGVFNKILSALESSGSLMLLEYIISIVCRENEHICEEQVQKSLAKFSKFLSIDHQLSAIEVSYKIFMQENSFPNEVRIATLQRFCLVQLQHSNVIAFHNFFVNNIKQIMKTLESNDDKNNEDKLKIQLTSKIGCYQLIAAMFNRLNKDQVYGTGSVIYQKYFNGNNGKGNELTRAVTLCGNVTRKFNLSNCSVNVMELRRKQNCSAYNMLIEVFCCTQTDVKMFNAFLFNENESKGEIFLDNLVDINKSYKFDLELEELFKRKRQLTRVRKEALEQKRAEMIDGAIEDELLQSVHYLTSQYLYGSSLSEEVSQFDFSLSNQVFTGVKAKPQIETSEKDIYEEMIMELDELNQHECMASMNTLIHHMHTTNMIPNEVGNESPTCVQMFINKLKSNLTHANVKLFIVKLFLNNPKIFEPFAKFLLETFMQIIINGTTGGCLNYLTNDLLIMILRWSQIAIPAETIIERSLANKVLTFTLKSCYHSRRDIYRNNLEIIKTLVELWKPRLDLQIQFIFDNLTDSDITSEKNSVGIQLLGIFLANGFPPYVSTYSIEKEKFFNALTKNLAFKYSQVYAAAAEVIGMAMNYLSEKEHEIEGVLHEQVFRQLNDLSSTQKDHFITSLYKLQLHYPPFAERLIHKIVYLLPKMHGQYQLMCLEIIEGQIERMDNAFQEMKMNDIDKLLTNKQERVQVAALKIVDKIARFCSAKDLLYLLKNVQVVLTQSSTLCRKLAYDICMWVYDNYKDQKHGDGEKLKNEAKSALLNGLADTDIALKLLVTNYWSHESRIPITTLDRSLAIINNLYSPSVEQHFLGYASFLLLEMTSRSPDFNRKIFEHPLSECDFVDYSVNYAWNARHSAMTPMFTQQSQSNLKEEEKLIKATQELNFTPTQDQSGVYNWLTQSSVNTFAITASLSESSLPSAMLFTQVKKVLTPGPNFGKDILQPTSENPQIQSSQSLDTLHLKQRILKDREKSNKFFAKREAINQKRRQETERVRVEKHRNQVTMYRKYRIGDLPDIQINHSALVAPLQALAEKDDVIAKMLLTSLVQAILQEAVTMYEEDRLENVYSNLTHSLNTILKESIKYFPAVIGFVMEIAYKQCSHMQLDCSDVVITCTASSQQNLGILLLESNIIEQENKIVDEPKAKKSKKPAAESDELKPWLKLVELYKSLNNYDVVRGILNKKFANRDLCEALEYESIGDYSEAINRYVKVIDEDTQKAFVYEIDFWEDSLLQCYNCLNNWDSLETQISNSLNENNVTFTWNVLWDDVYSQNHYLPYFLRAKSKQLLIRGRDEERVLQLFVNDALNDTKNPHRRIILENNYSDDLALLYAFQQNFSQAFHYLQYSLNNFLNTWSSSSPLRNIQRFAQAQDLQKLSEIYSFLAVDKDLNEVSKINRIKTLLNRWKNYQIDSLDSLLIWDDLISNRLLFIDMMCDIGGDEIKKSKFQEAKFCNWMAYIESATKQNNNYVALKKLKLFHNDKMAFVDKPEFIMRKYQLYIRTHLANSMQKSEIPKIKELLHCWEKLTNFPNKCDLVKTNLKFAAENHRMHAQVADNLADVFTRNSNIIHHIEDYKDQLELLIGKELSEERSSFDLWALSKKHLEEVVALAQHDRDESVFSRGHFDLALFCDNHLREAEENTKIEYPIYVTQNYPSVIVNSFLEAIKLGNQEAIKYFPRLLQIADRYPETRPEFKKTASIPCWMFLGWVSQMLALLDKEEATVVQDILLDIANSYPQALVYPFKLSRDGYKFKKPQHKSFVASLEKILNRVQHVDNFIFALGQLTDFDVLFQDYKRKVEEVIKKNRSAEEIMQQYTRMKTDLFQPDDTQWGAYRTEYAHQCRKEIEKLDSQMSKINLETFQNICKNLQKEIDTSKGKLLKRKLFINDYSKWLGNFNMMTTSELEVPGQYVGGQKPIPERHIKIAGFDQTVLNLSSIRRPRQITIYGNDEKEYKFLVKQGEDLRLDQRIQQLLTLMNKIFANDSVCASRRMKLITYQVIPLTTRLGLVEWVDNTLPLKAFLFSAMTKDELQLYLSEKNGITAQFYQWIQSKGGYIKSYKVRTVEVIANYKRLVGQVPKNLLKKAFLKMSSSLEAFLVLRNHFSISHATICMSHYFLGIGDRHLSNFMVDLNTGSMIGIDFGHAFGSATQFLPYPELMPFRLTPQLLSLMEPLREEGIFRQCLVHAASALRKNSPQLINLMDVFVKEPSLDWQEFAAKQAIIQGAADVDETRESSWYPLEKVAFAKRKLKGDNPAYIMRDELALGHKKCPTIKEMTMAIIGRADFKIRNRYTAEDLTVQQQVECLLQQATDENILGHTFHGWEPWI